MQEELTKTSTKQRIIIGIIAVLMLFATFGVYALIVLNGESSAKRDEETKAQLADLGDQLVSLQTELGEAADKLSDQHFKTFSSYLSNVKSYNAAAVDNAGLQTKDLKVGTGSEITKDSDYSVYYIGWCADESVFDSSFDDAKKPTKLSNPLTKDPSSGFIAGWEDGIVGMKVGGVREIDIPGELAYAETREICGGKNSPLKFILYAIDPGEDYTKKYAEFQDLRTQYNYLYYTLNSL